MANSFRVDNYKSAETLSYISIALLGFISLLNLIYFFFAIINLVNPMWQEYVEEGSLGFLFLTVIQLISVSEIFIFWLCVIFFLIWLYRAFSNLSPLKARNLEFSPGWAVGWWFVPIASLFKPYQAVTELWRESDPDYDEDLGFLSSVVSNPAFFGIWWGSWILSNITARITTKLGDSENPEMFKLFFASLIVSSLLTIIAGSILIYIIHEVTNRQEKRFQRIGESIRNLPPEPPVFNQ